MDLPPPLATPFNNGSDKDKEEVSEQVEELKEEYMLLDLEDINFHGAALPANCPYTLSGLDTRNPTLTLGDGSLKLIGEYEYTIGKCLVFTGHDEEAPAKSPVSTSESSSAPVPSQDKKINDVRSLQKKLKFRIMNVTTEKDKKEVPVRSTSNNQKIVPFTRATSFVWERFAQPLFSRSASGDSNKVTQHDTEAPEAAEIISRYDITIDTHGEDVPVRDTSNQKIVSLTRTTSFVRERIAQPLFSHSASGPDSNKVTQNDTEAPQAAEVISSNDIISDTNGKLPASCMCVEGHSRHRIQGVAGGLFVTFVGLFGFVVGLCWYWFGPSHATCTAGSVVECTGHVVKGMNIFPSAWQAVIAIVTGIASARLLLVVVNRRLASTSGASIAELEIGAQGLKALLSHRLLSIVNLQRLLPLAGIILVHVAMHAAQVYSSSEMVAKTVFVGATADVGNSYSTIAHRRQAQAPIFLSYYLSAAISVSECFTCVNVGYDSLTYIRNVSMAAPPLNAYQSGLGVEVVVSTLGSSGGDERLFGCPENTQVFINSSGLGNGKVYLRFSGSTCGVNFWWQVQVVAQELAVGVSVPSILTVEGTPAGQLTVLASWPTGRGVGDIELQNLVIAMQEFNVTSVDPSLIAIIGQGLGDGTTLNSLVVSWVAASISLIPAPGQPARVWTGIKTNVPVMMPGACIAMSSVGVLLVLSAALELYLRVGCPHNIHSLTLGQACAAAGTEGHYGCNDGGAHCRALDTSRWRLGVHSGRHLSVEQGELAIADPTVKYAGRLKIIYLGQILFPQKEDMRI